MKKAVGLLVALFALWLALSGYFKPFLLSLGVLSCLFTVYLASRMKLLDDEAVPLQLRPSLLLYWGWLGREVFKSSIAVSRVILAREMPISQQLVAVPCTQKTEMGHVIFANSITLTPGTVTAESGNGHFLVHALTDDFAAPEGFAEMDRRVTAVEDR
ncbi:Na+/H+ antiporter subunit E [Parvibaculum sp.]|jgi:multicomponent Na+:H+ antiporter subunit E|uniref:Na+/H+ antiporter subunit E n=1 Tax=Parvibaculum sp. TaxID=2024848 RepID=UPI000C65B83B|nr:Na+/H+ antiporter subunit E [Parvibaculum sp.]MAM93722.1 cation:proton antiporter [Parvibaculum sp.]HCX66692.1 cation:proton antiporter [Rhodobiaceae bacterium]|tara:strand:+ start:19726 stop:20199 length:474 start_codon:yes stop_codon:yes gene_type:complete